MLGCGNDAISSGTLLPSWISALLHHALLEHVDRVVNALLSLVLQLSVELFKQSPILYFTLDNGLFQIFYRRILCLNFHCLILDLLVQFINFVNFLLQCILIDFQFVPQIFKSSLMVIPVLVQLGL